MKIAALITGVFSALLAVFAALVLSKGSKPVSHAIVSWGGQSEDEIAFHASAKKYTTWGWIITALSAALAAASAFLGYFS